MIQRDDCPVLLREGVDRRAELGRLVAALENDVGPRTRIGALGQLAVRVTFAAVQTVATGVVGDREDPGRELGPRPEGPHRAKGLEEGFLGGVLRLLGIPERPQAKVVDGALVALDEGPEGLAVAGQGPCHQRRIVVDLEGSGPRAHARPRLSQRCHVRRYGCGPDWVSGRNTAPARAYL